ncbi:MAG: transporter substrate-binding domain-containing protein [Motiliproteus sp.]
MVNMQNTEQCSKRTPNTARGGVAVIALLVLWFASVSGLAEARSYEDVMADGTLVVAVYRDFPPYAYIEDDQPKGVDVDLAQKVAKALGLALKLHWMIADENLDDDLRNHVWQGHYLAREEQGAMLRRTVADVMFRAPYDREFAFKVDPDGRVMNDLVHFFSPYQRERWALLYDEQQMETFENLAVFQYERVGVEIDSLPDFYLSSAFRGRLRENIEHFPTVLDAMSAMDQKRIPSVMGMQSQLQWGVSRLARSEHMLQADVPFPNLAKGKWDVGMAVKDSHRQLAYRIEDVVDSLVKSGRMAKIYQRYGVQYAKPDRYLQLE